MLKIAYQGIQGCYSQQAIDTFFYNKARSITKESFTEVFISLVRGDCDAGLIPIENCLGGSIHENYDLLAKYNVVVRGEYNLKIEHCLLVQEGVQLSDLKKVVSHPQALSQCRNNCEALCLTKIPFYDTAGSAKYIRDQNLRDTAAIAGSRAADFYGLTIIKSNFGDRDDCFTRFLLISRNNNEETKLKIDRLTLQTEYTTLKSSIIISLSHSAGSLVKVLNIFDLYNISLTKIESRPDRYGISNGNSNRNGATFSYLFYLDFIVTDFAARTDTLRKIYAILPDHVTYLRILGSYPENSLVYQPNRRLNIGIVGFGRFGQFMAKKLAINHNILVTSRTDYSEVCDELGAKYYSDIDGLLGNGNSVDVILISVSITSFQKVLEGLISSPKLKDLLIVDVLSVKEHPKTLMLNRLVESCDILATHPMFGPDSCLTNCWSDQPFVFEKVRITKIERYNLFMASFSECNLIEMSSTKHDTLAARSQFITHLIGQLLELQKTVSTAIDTKSFSLLLQLKNIVGNDSHDLFMGLYKYNKYSEEQLKLFMTNIKSIKKLLE